MLARRRVEGRPAPPRRRGRPFPRLAGASNRRFAPGRGDRRDGKHLSAVPKQYQEQGPRRLGGGADRPLARDRPGLVGPIRLLFIDGDHSYEETRRDVEAWNGFIGEEGLMAFHDVGAWPGVTKFYDDFLAAGAWREVMRVRSLRVVQRAG